MQELERLKNELKKINAEAAGIRDLPAEKRGDFGREINAKRQAILAQITEAEKAALDVDVQPIDVTAWCEVNEALPDFYGVEMGARHPLMSELDRVVEIYQLMGFDVKESRQLDNEYFMFDSLNFGSRNPSSHTGRTAAAAP